jgi:hypothetical protein
MRHSTDSSPQSIKTSCDLSKPEVIVKPKTWMSTAQLDMAHHGTMAYSTKTFGYYPFVTHFSWTNVDRPLLAESTSRLGPGRTAKRGFIKNLWDPVGLKFMFVFGIHWRFRHYKRILVHGSSSKLDCPDLVPCWGRTLAQNHAVLQDPERDPKHLGVWW